MGKTHQVRESIITKLQDLNGYLSDIPTLISNSFSDEILHYVIHELDCPITSPRKRFWPATPLLSTVLPRLHMFGY